MNHKKLITLLLLAVILLAACSNNKVQSDIGEPKVDIVIKNDADNTEQEIKEVKKELTFHEHMINVKEESEKINSLAVESIFVIKEDKTESKLSAKTNIFYNDKKEIRKALVESSEPAYQIIMPESKDKKMYVVENGADTFTEKKVDKYTVNPDYFKTVDSLLEVSQKNKDGFIVKENEDSSVEILSKDWMKIQLPESLLEQYKLKKEISKEETTKPYMFIKIDTNSYKIKEVTFKFEDANSKINNQIEAKFSDFNKADDKLIVEPQKKDPN